MEHFQPPELLGQSLRERLSGFASGRSLTDRLQSVGDEPGESSIVIDLDTASIDLEAGRR